MSIESLTEKLLKGKKNEKFFVAVIPVSENGEVLLGKRTEDGIWTTPGGGSEPGEEPHQTARRELFEEAGLAAAPNALELVGVSETPRGFKIYSFLWRMPSVFAQVATPKLDPDQEVKSWKLYRPEDFPSAMQSEQNASRLKTIREALMKLYGINKSTPAERTKAIAAWMYDPECQMETIEDLTEDRIETLIAKLTKGGPGSGVKGHITKQPWDESVKDTPEYDVRRHEKKAAKIKAELDKVKAEYKAKFGQDYETKIEKGGPGSGQVGHVTAKQPSPLHPQVHSDIAKPVNKIQAHLTSLQHGKVMPGLSTTSGKPVANDMDVARAHGYDVQDHVDAMNAHYELAQKTQAMLEKFKTAGHKVPAEGAKIAQFHEKKMREHMKARQYLEQRREHTEAQLKEQKSVRKSVTQMGGALGDRDLDVGSFAQANGQGNAEWMERLYSGMEGHSFGDDPRDFETPAGTLHLTRVDDGIYTGYFTKKEEGLSDNAKIRIERITVPELVQLMIAKEWINNHMLEQDQAPEVAPPQMPDPMISLNSALLAPMNPPQEDRTVRILELLAKLTS